MPTRLTDRAVGALKSSGKPNSEYHFDSVVSGLALRIYPTGRKAFVFEWRELGRVRRVTLGRPPGWTVGKARQYASRLRLRADVGAPVKPRRGALIKDLAERWLDVVKLTRRPRTAESYRRLIERHVVPHFGNSEPREIGRNDVERWHGQIASRVPVEANRALAAFCTFLSWLERDGLVAFNAARGVKYRPENQRQVFLDATEIEKALRALDADTDRAAALALRLTLLTGCRVGEALNPRLAEQVDAKRALWTKPAWAVKQARQHIVPLSAAALAAASELIALGPPGYRACRRTWSRVKGVLGRPDARIHDLRHSRASALARSGASLPQIGRLLGHTSPGVTLRYSHLVAADLRDLVERS